MTATEAAAHPGGLARSRPARRCPGRSQARSLCAAAVAVLGQAPPSLVNLAGGGLAVVTQLRLGWLYTMVGHAVAIEAAGSADG